MANAVCLLFLPVLMIIKVQADIEKLSKTAKTDGDFKKIKGGFRSDPGCFTEQQLMKHRVCRTPTPLERADRRDSRRR